MWTMTVGYGSLWGFLITPYLADRTGGRLGSEQRGAGLAGQSFYRGLRCAVFLATTSRLPRIRRTPMPDPGGLTTHLRMNEGETTKGAIAEAGAVLCPRDVVRAARL